ncbi:MAG: radical SAM protein [Candidatus Woesearchaeota archaeon]
MAIIQVASLQELYADRSLYSTPDQFSPPSERLSHVLRLEPVIGCPWKRCTFCEGYDDVTHLVKKSQEYEAHVNEVFARVGKKSDLARGLERLFLGGGDSFELSHDVLQHYVAYTRNQFLKHTKNDPRRLSVYGRTRSLLNYGAQGLDDLTGVDLCYVGIESGATSVLDYVRKGVTSQDVVTMGEMAREYELDLSVMIILGLGGNWLSAEHVHETAEVLGKVRPRYITFMGINVSEETQYYKIMAQEVAAHTNRPLTDFELLKEAWGIIHAMPFFETTIGNFDSSVDGVGHNPYSFGSRRFEDRRDKSRLDEELCRIIHEQERPHTKRLYNIPFELYGTVALPPVPIAFLEPPNSFELNVPTGEDILSKGDYVISAKKGIDTVLAFIITILKEILCIGKKILHSLFIQLMLFTGLKICVGI